jgi:hypothetical protein
MGRRLFRVSLFALMVIGGCATPPPPPEAPIPSSYLSSRDGDLHYLVPDGWFDATSDSQAAGPVIWILRSDFGATITVNEIHVDAQARRDLGKGGLLQLARLTQSLRSQNDQSVLLHPPRLFTSGGRQLCTYDLLSGKDTVRVILVDTGRRVYTVSALVQGTGDEAGSSEVFDVVQRFVNTLRW